MKNKIQKMVIGILVGMLLVVQVPVFAYEEGSGLLVPVRFKYDVSSDSLQEGDAVPLEVVENVYLNGAVLFKEYSSGIAYVNSYKKSAFLGRGGKIEITSGYLNDVNGKRHSITLSSSAKGRGSLAPLILSLATAGLGVGIWQGIGSLKAKSVPILLGSAATLGAIGLASMTGKEAVLSSGKVIFVHVN